MGIPGHRPPGVTHRPLSNLSRDSSQVSNIFFVAQAVQRKLTQLNEKVEQTHKDNKILRDTVSVLEQKNYAHERKLEEMHAGIPTGRALRQEKSMQTYSYELMQILCSISLREFLAHM